MLTHVHASHNTHADVNFQELARCTEDFNGAMLKAVWTTLAPPSSAATAMVGES